MEFNITNKDKVVKTIKLPNAIGSGITGMMIGPVIGLASGLIVGVFDDLAKLLKKK